MWAECGQSQTRLPNTRSKITILPAHRVAHVLPTSANFDRVRANFDRVRANVGPFRAKFGRLLADVGPDVGRLWPKGGPNLVAKRPSLAETDGYRLQIGRSLPDVCRDKTQSSGCRRNLPKIWFGEVRIISAEFRPETRSMSTGADPICTNVGLFSKTLRDPAPERELRNIT